MYTILLVIHSIIVLFLIGLVLIQRTDSDGMGGLSGALRWLLIVYKALACSCTA